MAQKPKPKPMSNCIMIFLFPFLVFSQFSDRELQIVSLSGHKNHYKFITLFRYAILVFFVIFTLPPKDNKMERQREKTINFSYKKKFKGEKHILSVAVWNK